MMKQELILLALDASPILDLMERALRAAGYEVAVAHDRPSMDRSIQEAIPALVIIGEKFADAEGLSMSREMLERFPTLPIILYTEQDTTGLLRSAFKASLEKKAKISETERIKLEAIISNIQDGVIVIDEHQHILLINHAVRDIFRLSGDPLAGKPLKDVIANDHLHALLVRASDGPLKYHEINFNDGRVFNAQYTPIPKIGGAVT